MGLRFDYGASRVRARVGDTFEVSIDGDAWQPVIRNADENYPLPTNTVLATTLGMSPSNSAAVNQAAWDAAMAAIPVNANRRWLFGTGTYNFTGPLQVKRSMVIEGVSNGYLGTTQFQFPGTQHGITVHYTDLGGSSNGSGSIIRCLVVNATGATAGKHGIWVKGYGVSLEHIQAYSWGGNGIRINASVAEEPPTNANGWRVLDCTVSFNGSHGFFTQGGDSNAGVAIGVRSIGNTGYGIYDDSFLGNTYIGTETLANTVGGYYARGASQRNVFLNPYGEGDEDASLIDSPNVVLGSLISPGIVGNCATYYGGSANNPVLYLATGAGQTQIGSIDSSKAFLQFYPTVDTLPIKFKFGQTTNPFSGCYEWNYADLSGASRFALAGENGKLTAAFKCALDPATPIASDGIILGGRRVFYGTAAPAAGTNNKGDRLYYIAPSAGGREGLVCTASGTAGAYAEGRTATTNGTANVTLSGASTVLKVGTCVTINSTDVRIATISGTAVTVEAIEDGASATIAAAAGQAIAYKAPTWKEFGDIAA